MISSLAVHTIFGNNLLIPSVIYIQSHSLGSFPQVAHFIKKSGFFRLSLAEETSAWADYLVQHIYHSEEGQRCCVYVEEGFKATSESQKRLSARRDGQMPPESGRTRTLNQVRKLLKS